MRSGAPELPAVSRQVREIGWQELAYQILDLPTFAAKQRVIGGVLYQCVLERVIEVRWCPSLKYQLCCHEFTQLVSQCGLWI